MSSSQRFGFAVAAAPRQKSGLDERLQQALASAPDALGKHLTAPLELADGVGTLILDGSEPAFDLAVACQEAMWPLPLRFALIAAPPAGAAGRDEAVRAKAAKSLARMDKKGVFRFDLPNRTDEELALADALVRLHRTLVQEWTTQRCGAVRAYRRLGHQGLVAKDLGVSQQAVSQMLLGARWRDLVAAEDALRRWLTPPARTTLWPLRSNRVPAQA